MRVLGDVELPVSMLRVGDRVERGGRPEAVVGLSVLPGEALITIGCEDVSCKPQKSFRVLLRYVDDDGVEHQSYPSSGRVTNWHSRAPGGIWEDE